MAGGVRDVRLGYKETRQIRELIHNNRTELLRYGSSERRVGMIEAGKGAEGEVQEYWLNRKQPQSGNFPGCQNVRGGRRTTAAQSGIVIVSYGRSYGISFAGI